LSLRGAAQRRSNPSQPGTIGRRIAPLRFETTPDYYLYGDISKPADRGWVRVTAWPRLLFNPPPLSPTMTTLELKDHDKSALAAVLRTTIAGITA